MFMHRRDLLVRGAASGALLAAAVYSRAQGADRAFASLDGPTIPWSGGLSAASAQVFLLKLSYWW